MTNQQTPVPTPKPADDTKVSVKVSKVDAADGKRLADAKLQVLDKEGNKIAEWTSSKDKAYEVTGLDCDTEYTLHEETAPDGYDVSEDKIFVMKADGTIDESKTKAKVKDGELIVEDTAKKAGTTTTTSSNKASGGDTSAKTSSSTGDALAGLVGGLAFLSMLSAGAIGIVRRRMRNDD